MILADDGEAIDMRHLSGLSQGGQRERVGTVSWEAGPAIGIRLPENEPSGVGLAQQENASHEQLLNLAKRALQRGPVKLPDIEEVYIEVAMEQCEGNVSKAAALLGLTRAQLDYRLKKMAQSEES
ncbi:Bacterial regulatory protein, Fis family [compost metagenome]